jgi:hypothetical protein
VLGQAVARSAEGASAERETASTIPFAGAQQRAQDLALPRAVVDNLLDAGVELEQQQHFLRERVDARRQRRHAGTKPELGARRRQLLPELVPLVALARALEQQRVDRRANAQLRHRLVRDELEAPDSPAEEPEQRLLPLDVPEQRVDRLAVLQVDEPLPHPPRGARLGEHERARATIDGEHLQQIGEGHLDEIARDSALRVARHLEPLGALEDDRTTSSTA